MQKSHILALIALFSFNAVTTSSLYAKDKEKIITVADLTIDTVKVMLGTAVFYVLMTQCPSFSEYMIPEKPDITNKVAYAHYQIWTDVGKTVFGLIYAESIKELCQDLKSFFFQTATHRFAEISETF